MGAEGVRMKALPRTRSCFVCGLHNPIGLNLQLETDERIVRGWLRPKPEHAGFSATVHGGLLMTVLDEAMVWVCGIHTGQFAYSAEINTRFLKPLHPGEEVEVTAEFVANRKNRLFETRAFLRGADQGLIASATGKYLPIPADHAASALDDFVGDVQAILRRAAASPPP